MCIEKLRAEFSEHGQEHVLSFYDELDDQGKHNLIESCQSIDFAWLESRIKNLRDSTEEYTIPQKISPPEIIPLPKTDTEKAALQEATSIGEQALKNGKVGVFLVAGGQGTRLGFEGPKGCLEIGPNSNKTIFQWHAEQIKARATRYNTTIPWYIMTSTLNHDETMSYFNDNNYFDLGEENVMFFKQRMVPSIDNNYRLILAAKDKIAVNPDGHGGCLWAICNSGACTDMKERGVEYLSFFQVDNPLVKIADPAFIGYHIHNKALMSSKAIAKSYPEEKVGHFCIGDGKTVIIEYCDMSTENMHALDGSGRLKFWAGSTAIHVISVDFIEEVTKNSKLPWHVAKKKIPYIDIEGGKVIPAENNGIKFETFVFDALPLSNSTATMEVSRQEEFAPVKNSVGVDSAETCQQLMSNKFGLWLEAAGKKVPRNNDGDVTIKIEISPLFALDIDEFCKKCPTDLELTKNLTIE